ncbi:MAG: hypothetical protein K1X71_08375 [Pirellulales bacterium]|nr:hypothetical protein [Pirellulales bacterium]
MRHYLIGIDTWPFPGQLESAFLLIVRQVAARATVKRIFRESYKGVDSEETSFEPTNEEMEQYWENGPTTLKMTIDSDEFAALVRESVTSATSISVDFRFNLRSRRAIDLQLSLHGAHTEPFGDIGWFGPIRATCLFPEVYAPMFEFQAPAKSRFRALLATLRGLLPVFSAKANGRDVASEHDPSEVVAMGIYDDLTDLFLIATGNNLAPDEPLVEHAHVNLDGIAVSLLDCSFVMHARLTEFVRDYARILQRERDGTSLSYTFRPDWRAMEIAPVDQNENADNLDDGWARALAEAGGEKLDGELSTLDDARIRNLLTVNDLDVRAAFDELSFEEAGGECTLLKNGGFLWSTLPPLRLNGLYERLLAVIEERRA